MNILRSTPDRVLKMEILKQALPVKYSLKIKLKFYNFFKYKFISCVAYV